MHFIGKQSRGFPEMAEGNEEVHMGRIARKLRRLIEGDRHVHYHQCSNYFIGHICQNL